MKENYFNMSVRNLTNRLRKFDNVIKQELENAILSNKKFILNCIRDNLSEGFNGNNEFIADYRPYSRRTIRKKRERGQPTTRVTLRDTGKFYESFDIRATPDGFIIYSRDNKGKQKSLIKRYKPTILRLDNESLSRLLNERIRPYLSKKMESYLKYEAFKQFQKDWGGIEYD